MDTEKNVDLEAYLECLETSNADQAKYAKRQYRMSVITCLVSLAILAAVLYTCAVLIPKVNATFDHVSVVMNDIEMITTELANADLSSMIKDVDHLVITSEQHIQDALNQVNSIDINALNKAIKDLSDIIAPIAKLFGGR